MKALLIESPVANLASIRGALMEAGADVEVTADPRIVARAERIVLPGVGSFPAAARWLEGTGVAGALRDAAAGGAAILGICLGHQLLFETSEEGESAAGGVALLEGEVTSLGDRLPLPLVGWGRVVFAEDPLFAEIASPAEFYFVHSFRAVPTHASDVVAAASYGETYPAAVRRGRVCGVQFHPEKSSAAGLRLLSNFLERI
ncbi:MAG TPA: imidazole glycerol phosphate synthase subunit HisH [Thermoanaerobaculia bacterium]|nr:imidazole glycerol phosphate synthase subunit HisH [Thermoanaerobaculia bacterium]